MKKSYSFIAVLVGIILMLTITQVVVSNRLSTTGLVLGKLQDEIALFKTENTILSEKLLVASSFTSIASAAAQLGFSETKTAIVLTAPLPIARH